MWLVVVSWPMLKHVVIIEKWQKNKLSLVKDFA
jgi:hypothetical protein